MNLLRRRFKIAHLIAEEFAGVITKENQARLEQWRVESPAHAKEYDEIRTYIMTGNEYWEKEKRTVRMSGENLSVFISESMLFGKK